ncbi:unnamed protein product [Moneuplotes crassus]|uniref:Uncharacterized protein n=1 Tax=Euplotes crassus TaxID=5936 RepID=A0AAD1XHV4_EUPCR|nr:unnamed protein product [Moneuplotes crassus]
MSSNKNIFIENEGENTEDAVQTDDGTATTVEEYKISSFDPTSDISDPKVVEIWVDNILKDAESVEDYHKFLKKNSLSPLVRYGIDRDHLKYLGVADHNIDRLYRAFFVYSIGFYELLQSITVGIKASNSINHSEVMGSLWRVYSILLEFCCKSDYKLLISKIKSDHEIEKEGLKDRIQWHHERFLEQEIEFRKKFKEAEIENATYLKEKATTKRYIAKLNDIITDLRAKIEEETKVRKVFENKLNDLHSIVRDRDATYTRAKVDLDHLLQDNISKEDQLFKLLKEYKEISEKKTEFQVQYDATLQDLNKTQDNLDRERLERLKEVKNLKNELKTTKTTLFKIEKNYKENLSELQKLRQVHHEMSKNYSDDKETLKKYNRDYQSITKLESVIESLRKECNELTEDLAGTREREIQYKKIAEDAKKEKDEIREELNQFIVKYSGLQGRYVEVENHLNNKTQQLKDQGIRLDETEKERVKIHEISEQAKAKNLHLEKELKEKCKMVDIQRESMNRLKNKLIQAENEYDALNGKHNTDREVLQTEIYQLKHEVSVLTEKVNVLKNSRGHLLKNMDTEAQENEKLRGKVHNMRNKLSDAFADKKNIEGERNKFDMMRIRTEEILLEKEQQYTDLFKQKESLNLMLSTNTEMHDHYEKKTGEYIQRIRNENKKLKLLIEQEKDRGLMMHEDIRTRCAYACLEYQTMLLEKIEAQKSMSGKNAKIHSLECDVEVARIKIKSLMEELEIAKKSHNELESKYNAKRNQIALLKKELTNLKSENEIFRRVIYDPNVSKPLPEERSQSDLSKSVSRAIEINNGDLVQIKNVISETNSDSSYKGETRDVGVLTDACKRKDNFMQTEAHGFIEIQDIIRRNSFINVNRKFSSKTAVGFCYNPDDGRISKDTHSETEMKNYIIPPNVGNKNKTLKNNEYKDIEQIINSESESVSRETNPKMRNKDLEDSIKIDVSPLEKVTTIKSIQNKKGNIVVSKVVDCVPQSSKDMKKRRVMQPEIVDKTRATTSKNQMKPLMTPNYLILQGKRAKYLKSTSRYKKNPSSIEGEFKSTLMSERVSRNTSTDELKETMKSVYGKGK